MQNKLILSFLLLVSSYAVAQDVVIVEEPATPDLKLSYRKVEGDNGVTYPGVRLRNITDKTQTLYVLAGLAKTHDSAQAKCAEVGSGFELISQWDHFMLSMSGKLRHLGDVQAYDLGPDSFVQGDSITISEDSGAFHPFWFQWDSLYTGEALEGTDKMVVFQSVNDANRVVSLKEQIQILQDKLDKVKMGKVTSLPGQQEALQATIQMLKKGVEVYCAEVSMQK